jgi:hypothetical protein
MTLPLDKRAVAATAVFASVSAAEIVKRFTTNPALIAIQSSQNIAAQIEEIEGQLRYSVLRTIIQQNSASGVYGTFRDSAQYTENSEAKLTAAIQTAIILVSQLTTLAQSVNSHYFPDLTYQLDGAKSVIANSLLSLESLE